MKDLERLYRQLVATLNANGSARWQDPLRLSDLLNVLPYRAARRVLNIDSSEEFELLMLRLAGGEGGFMSTEPEAVGQRFALEAVSTNPELGVLREYKDACVMFVPGPLMRVLSGSTGDEAWAPPGARVLEPEPVDTARIPAAPVPPAPGPPAAAPARPVSPATPAAARRPAQAPPPQATTPSTQRPPTAPPPPTRGTATALCTACNRALPAGRAVSFCPHCGQGQAMGHCARCGADADLSWHFCPTCGVGLPWSTYR